jgi:hypothetical protein
VRTSTSLSAGGTSASAISSQARFSGSDSAKSAKLRHDHEHKRGVHLRTAGWIVLSGDGAHHAERWINHDKPQYYG